MADAADKRDGARVSGMIEVGAAPLILILLLILILIPLPKDQEQEQEQEQEVGAKFERTRPPFGQKTPRWTPPGGLSEMREIPTKVCPVLLQIPQRFPALA